MTKMKKLAHLILALVLVLSLTVGATATVLADKNNYSGSFDILVSKNGDWQLQGELSFSDYETLQLPLDNGAGQLKLRLEQHGHDGAFVDYVAVQKEDTTYLPISAINIDSSIDVLTKVLSPEYDVCDAWDSTLEIVWDNVPENVTLFMRAMEEDFGEGHGVPLYYPCIQLGNTLSHTLVNDGGITVDGLLDELDEPDFTVFWQPDSPHPDGYTYGWLHCDNEYLYAAVEVTADNTLDEEDWGALYVMLNGKLEEFRITDDDTHWGVNGFQYTSSVPYEHRVYEFQIPLSEIDASIGAEVQYGFGCYGTVALEPCDVHDDGYNFEFPIPNETFRIYGQTFTTHWEYDLAQVDMDIYPEEYDGGNFTLKICNYDEEEGKPGSLLGSSTEILSHDTYHDGWSSFYFEPEIPLQACQKYVMLLNIVSVDGYVWLRGTSNNEYTEGESIRSSTSGSTWFFVEDEDFRFRLFGCLEGTWDPCGEPSPTPPPSQPTGEAVGGDVFPADKVSLIAPWLGLAVVILAGGVFLVRRRVHSVK